jgi:hypothetical protein
MVAQKGQTVILQIFSLVLQAKVFKEYASTDIRVAKEQTEPMYVDTFTQYNGITCDRCSYL